MAYDSKNSQVLARQLKVQRLAIPFVVTANATPASVVLRNDEPSVLFIRSEGVDQITTGTGALASGETATYSVAAHDANGILNFYIKLDGDDCSKVLWAAVIDRVNGTYQPCKLGDADGVSSVSNIMLTADTTVNLSTTDLNACLVVEYVVAE